MKRHCKQHGIDKTAAVKMLKHSDIDLDDAWHGGKEESYQLFKERCVLLFQRVLHRWQADMEVPCYCDVNLCSAAQLSVHDSIYSLDRTAQLQLPV